MELREKGVLVVGFDKALDEEHREGSGIVLPQSIGPVEGFT